MVGVAAVAAGIYGDKRDFTASSAGTWSAAIADLSSERQTDPKVLEALTALAIELEKQQARQVELAAVVAELQARSDAATVALAVVESATPALAENSATARTQSRFRGRRGKVQRDDLIEAGFNSYEAEQIITLADETTLSRLNLEYQATREGWRREPEYRERMAEHPSIRDRISQVHGEEAYDRYLYASGRPNRVLVRDIYASSAAEAAGLQAGDKVIAMANSRVYSMSDLRTIATSGTAGEMVPITIEREGAQFEVFVPRGPLGVRTERGYENPTPD